MKVFQCSGILRQALLSLSKTKQGFGFGISDNAEFIAVTVDAAAQTFGAETDGILYHRANLANPIVAPPVGGVPVGGGLTLELTKLHGVSNTGQAGGETTTITLASSPWDLLNLM